MERERERENLTDGGCPGVAREQSGLSLFLCVRGVSWVSQGYWWAEIALCLCDEAPDVLRPSTIIARAYSRQQRDSQQVTRSTRWPRHRRKG